eukprot:11160983-Heterocapsa_arctica.AAC.1
MMRPQVDSPESAWVAAPTKAGDVCSLLSKLCFLQAHNAVKGTEPGCQITVMPVMLFLDRGVTSVWMEVVVCRS